MTRERSIAILGAHGFIGARAVEMFVSEGRRVRAIVRRAPSNSAAVPSCETKLADACDPVALYRAFLGCDAIVHVVNGDPETLVRSAAAARDAALAAGVRRVIYLGSAAVHGQAPREGTDERAPLRLGHAFAYNDAKIRAERRLSFGRGRALDVVVLRPQIVYGPRAYWVERVARDLVEGAGYLVDDGAGVCDAIHVDDVVHAVSNALDAPGVAGEVFLLGDGERTSWLDFYRPLADALGCPLDAIARVSPPSPQPTLRQRFLDPLRKSVVLEELADCAPRPMRRHLDRLLARRIPTPQPVSPPSPSRSRPESVTPEPMLVALQRCTHDLPIGKAREVLGWSPRVQFAEGMQAAARWAVRALESHA